MVAGWSAICGVPASRWPIVHRFPRFTFHLMRVGIIHVHSDYSHDGKDSLERLHAFALERGVSFVSLTDHAEDFTPARFADYTAHCRRVSDERVRLIPGL